MGIRILPKNDNLQRYACQSARDCIISIARDQMIKLEESKANNSILRVLSLTGQCPASAVEF